ncbi:MAG: T9SS C-terminal target domain-containing protein [Bacteroidetes bacterium]|nr:T9SS C-terminal target domain-containing protein [Bacteroidota bacterium]
MNCNNLYRFNLVSFIVFLWTISTPVIAQWNAQGLCGTAEPTPDHFAHLEELNKRFDLGIERVSNNRIMVPVKIHVVQDIGGNSYDFNTWLTVLCQLNEKYASSGLFFYMKGEPNIIANSSLYRHTSYAQGAQLMDTYNQSRVVNIYFVDLGSIGLCGYATFPGSGSGPSGSAQGGLMMSVPCSQSGNTTLAHEMGHYFALPHPFDGTSGDPTGPFSERVTRNTNETPPRLSANCATAGDRFCDTEADYIGYRWNCFGFTPSDTDRNGDTFVPDAALYMSYSNDNCQNRFSDQQIQTMRSTLAGPSASRGYLLLQPPYFVDTLAGTTTPLSPVAGGPAQPANWVQFRWRKVDGATSYMIRIRRNNLKVTDVFVHGGDTALTYTLPVLQPNLTYTYTIRPYNPGWTCAAQSASGTFTTTAGYGTLINETEKNDLLQIYPTILENDQRKIFVQLDAEDLRNITIYDAAGRQVQLIEQYRTRGDRLETEILPLPAGLYHIRVNGESGNNYMSKMIVR